MSGGSLKIIRNFDDPFTHIENSILRDKRMSLAERGFFALILSLPTRKEMTLRYFSKISGANKETVGRYFHKLEELGYLHRYQERGDHGVFGTTIYELTTSTIPPCTDFPATAEPCTVEPSPAEPSPAEPCTENPAQKNNVRKNNPPISPQGERAERFDAFWAFYRDRVCADDHSRAGSKAKAKKAWDKLGPDDAKADAIAAYLLARMRTEMWRRGIGIPYASSLLNAIDRGETDLTPEPPDARSGTRAAAEDREEAFGQWH